MSPAPRMGWGSWGVVTEVMKRGRLRAMWWARYVDEAGARENYARQVAKGHRAALVVMVMPQRPYHRCAFTWCACQERQAAFSNVPALEIDDGWRDE